MNLLLTAGPTREYFDSVRFLSNASTGRMGYAIAAEAVRRGHHVILVSGPVDITPPEGVELIRVVSASEMLAAAARGFDRADAAIMAAAVCDYRPATREATKMPKALSGLSLSLEPTADICAHLGAIKGTRVMVGFAMEDHDHHAHAEGKLRRKHCDAIILNDVSTAGAESGSIEIFRSAGGWSGRHSGTKAALAAAIVDLVEGLVSPRG
jgi:phosphopantothenoylcysteine decarboxylase/phosphopantothenate--cysteine ligase